MSRRGIARRIGIWLLRVAVFAVATPAFAQAVRRTTPPAFDVSVGGGVVAGIALGESDANLRANRPTLTDYRLFSTESRLRAAPAFTATVAASVARRVAIEGRIHVAKPELETVITNDVEGAPDVTLTERLTEWLLGGGVRFRLDDPRRQARTMPHVSAGVGVLRQTHEDGSDAEQEPVVYVGGGVRHAFGARRGGAPRSGVRGDVQLLMVRSALSTDDKVTRRIAVTGGVFFSF